jgi:hypothetical protein
MNIYAVAGHGAGDPGACAHGYQEQERVRVLADRLKALGGDSVTVGDKSIDWYASNRFASVSIPKDTAVIELHMDSATASARGGHVIIKQGFSADAFDNALANFIVSYFPGRSNKLVGRADLQNVNVCANRGINYRLLEVCFISNAGDIAKFNADVDAVARGILGAAGIEVASPAPLQTGIDMWAYTPNNTSAQLFKKTYVDGAWFKLTKKGSNLNVDMADAGTKSGNRICAYPDNGTAAQLWKYEGMELIPKIAQDLRVDVKGGAKESGTPLWAHTANGTGAQQWAEIDHGDGCVCYINPQSMLAMDVRGNGL